MSGYEGFVPSPMFASTTTMDGPVPNYQRETDRLASFKNWPNPNVAPEALARAGFFYFNDSDKVKCAWCSGVVAEWEVGDNAFDEHKRLFPTCPLITQGGDERDTGIQEFKAPKKPMYACLSARLRSYENWPRSDIQKPEVLAEAGFYYQNVDDQVRCFHCNGGLRSWRKEDVPWYEHAKWFPQCQYVQLAKGRPFVRQVLGQMTQRVCHESPSRIGDDQSDGRMSLDDAMSTEPVRLALQMGLNGGRIKSATKQRLDLYGRPYNTAEELVEAVLEGQAGEEVYREEEEANRTVLNPTVIREVSRFFENIVNSARTESDESPSFPSAQSSSSPQPNSTVPEINNHGESPLNASRSCSSSELAKPEAANEAAVELMQQMSLEEENRRLKDARTCKICMDDECGVVFLPCGHLVACVLCAPGIAQCPICRSPIKGFVRTYLS